MPRGIKKEKIRERNDSLIIIKADGGSVESDDVYQEFGELHSDTDGTTINIQYKIPVFKPTVLGRPPIQDKMIYYIDAEPQDPGFDPAFMYGKLKSAYHLSFADNTNEGEKDRKHRRLMDTLFILAGAAMLVFAFFIGPLIGFSLKTSGEGDEPVVPPPAPASRAVENDDYRSAEYARIRT